MAEKQIMNSYDRERLKALEAANPQLVSAIRREIVASMERMEPSWSTEIIDDVCKVWTNCREPSPWSEVYLVFERMEEEGLFRLHRSYQGWDGNDCYSLKKRKQVVHKDRQRKIRFRYSTAVKSREKTDVS